MPDTRIVMWPEEPDGAWRLFTKPSKILTANSPEEVPAVLHAVQRAADSGLHAAGFLSYEASPGLDGACETHQATTMPLAWFALFENTTELREPPADTSSLDTGDWKPSMALDSYTAALQSIRRYLKSGDTYQVNYTMRLTTSLAGDPYDLFWRLWRMQRAKYCAFIETDDFAICSASPELFFSLDGNELTSRPMKGTAPRGMTFEGDNEAATELHESEKNRAENVMIVDMVRNDMGRIADAGSVHVPSSFDVERYPTVLQMTSTVACTTAAPFTEIVTALFPCASITGAPKIRTMQIIKELEPTPRGVYTGCIGYLSPGRKAAFNVAIRTLVVGKDSERAEYGVGGGIVWDSDADNEYEECRLKASVLTARVPAFQLLESLLWEPEHDYFLLDLHLERLDKTARYFDFELDLRIVRKQLSAVAEALDTPSKVRLLVSRDGSIQVESQPVDAAAVKEPWIVDVCESPVDRTDPFLYHKTTNRGVYERAKDSCQQCDDVILINEAGEVTESTVANVVIENGGGPITPPVSSGLLGGVFRADLLRRGKLTEQVITRDDLRAADSVFLINSVRQWIPVKLR